MMLEGKVPIQMPTNNGGASGERIVYQTVEGENKENNEALEEELRSKE